MNVSHRPTLDTKSVCEHYSERDGVSITYVCTTEQCRHSPLYDIFYRGTPHPEFGNRYFGLYKGSVASVSPDHSNVLMIGNADWVEGLDFCMIYHDGQWHYSQYTHDFHVVGTYAIDGGRSYGRVLGSTEGMPKSCYAGVKDGKFYITSDFV